MNRNLILIVSIFLSCVVVILLGNIITIGDKLGELTHIYVEYVFYAIIVLLTFIYIIFPIVKMHIAPEFPVLSADKSWDSKRLLEFANRLACNCDYITDISIRKEHQLELRKSIDFHSAEHDALLDIISREINLRINGDDNIKVLGINRRIKEWGKTVFMVTAVSQNSKIDAFSVLVMNFKLISDLISATGFRPTKPRLFRLYVSVLTTSLITYCTSSVLSDVDGVTPFDFGNSTDGVDVDLDEVDNKNFGTSFLEGLKRLTIPGFVVSSVIEGCMNSLLTMRIGYVTRAYLVEGPQALDSTKNKRSVKRKAIKEAFKSLPSVVSDGSIVVGKSAGNIIRKFIGGDDEENK